MSLQAPSSFKPTVSLGILTLLGSIISLCVGSSFAKSLFTDVGAEGTTFLRLGLSCIILMTIWRPWRFELELKNLKIIALYGCTLGAMNLLFYMALRTIPIGLAIAIEFSGPLFLALISSRKKIDFLWIALAVIGLFLLLPLKLSAQSLDLVGVLYAASAGVLWALYIIFGQRTAHIHPGQASSIGIFFAFLLVAPFGISAGGMALLNWHVLAFGLVVGILSSAVPYSLELIALRALPRKTISILLSLEPAIGALAGFFILHEHLSPEQIIAILLIVSASIGSAITATKEKK